MARSRARKLGRRAKRALQCSTRAWALSERARGASFVQPDTQLLIEGAPGSGNTFVRVAIHHANRDLRMASHRHNVAHVKRALHLGIPSLVLVRDPVDAVVSVMTRFKSNTEAEPVLDGWRYFNERMIPLLDSVVVATFEQATTQLGDVIGRVNARFGLDLVPFVDDDEHRAAVLSHIQSDERWRMGPDATARAAAPSGDRAADAARVRELVMADRLTELRERCESIASVLVEASYERQVVA